MKNTIDNTYNGWKNRQTWNVALHINNDYSLHTAAREFMQNRKNIKGAYYAFIKSIGMQYDRTPDNIGYISTRLCYPELDAMMKELI